MALFVPLDGRITSQNTLSGPLTGTEVMEIVSPGNAALGNTYQITTSVLAGFVSVGVSEIILSGATSGSPYLVQPADRRILFNKTSGSASFATCPLATTMLGGPVLFKDLKGDANTNNISVSFTGGELCDGQSSLQVKTNYGWFVITPIPGGGGWYQSG